MPKIELPIEFRHTRQLRIQYCISALFLLALIFPAVDGLLSIRITWFSVVLTIYVALLSLPLYVFIVEIVHRRPKCVCSEFGLRFRTIWGYNVEIPWSNIRTWCFRSKGRGAGPSHLEVKLSVRGGKTKRHLFFVGGLFPDLEVLRQILKAQAPRRRDRRTVIEHIPGS